MYPLERPNLERARALANGNLRGGKAVLYTNSSTIPMAIGQLVRQQLAEIGLDIEVKGIPIHSATAAYFKKLATPGEEWDLAFATLEPELHRSLRLHQPALRPAVRRGDELHALRLEPV